MSSGSNDQCEHCHSAFSFLKKKKTCAICRQSYCSNCAPRERNQSYRACLICQKISNEATTDSQLLELKVKHLRSYLQAKNIAHHTCTEKQELVALITRNRNVPFTNLYTEETSSELNNTNQSSANTQQPKSDSNSKPFANLQSSVSSFANQMNSFASNIQDYVTNTVSGVLNPILDDPLQQPTVASAGRSQNGAPFNSSSATSGPSHHARPTSNSATHTTSTASASTSNVRQPTASSHTTAKQQSRRKSLSEIKDEENIEDLNIRDLKEILAANFVDFKGCVEKGELLDKVRRLYRDRVNEKHKAKQLDDCPAGDNELCKICMDAIADCVFLDCGHMVTCVKCGKLLAECPICRSNIVRVVRVFKS
ncbi:unnamed protein product [Adineta ricciae]|uniref:RING-type domain-containing protein n=1 Tax=Adineta ricciae TaxID=249248 RepID=A0A814MU23_ADIRI|nr:unnamed protein product [Adineta ricciae]CAF1082543.1 unnamed protein product [Adineta ricciae]